MLKTISRYFKKDSYCDYDEASFHKEKLNLGDLDIEIHIHPAKVNAILIMCPGAEGNINGYNSKYYKIANMLRSKNIATVIRMGNEYCCTDKLPYIELIPYKLSSVIDYARENSEKLCGYKEFDLYLAGVSAGASFMAMVQQEFTWAKKVLFIAPSEAAGRENILKGLEKFRGEIYITAGEQDEIMTDKTAKYFYESAKLASRRELKIISDCDHQFTGERNGKILANAYLWAFSSESNFPSPKGGLVLYK